MYTCDANDLDADALLPPRKRLLAGLKKQSPDVNFSVPSTSNRVGSEFDARLDNYMRFQLNSSMSNEEIVEASRRAATEAAKIAEIARANAEDKAARAAKAVAAAKSALDLVTTLSEEASKNGKRSKKNKLKKHVPVESLYGRSKRKTNGRTDEELARNLHQSINTSSRISKNSGSDVKNKRALVKSSVSFSEGLIEERDGSSMPTSTGEAIVEELDSEDPVKEIDTITVDLNPSKSEKVVELTLNHREERSPSKLDGSKPKNEEVDRFHSNHNLADSSDSLGKKRGRIKQQKKLPLSICTFKDKTGQPTKSKDALESEGNARQTAAGDQPFVS